MAYAQLKTDIAAVIRNNGNQEITGNVLQGALLEMINALGANYQYAGVADTSTTITTTEANVFYLLTEAGTYSNMSSSIVHTSGIGLALWNGTAWSYQNVPYITDATLMANSTNPVQGGAVYEYVNKNVPTELWEAYDMNHASNIPFCISSSGGNYIWQSSRSNNHFFSAYRHSRIKCEAGDKFVIVANQSKDCVYAWLTSYATGYNESVPLVSGTTPTTISAGGFAVAEAPTGAKFLYILRTMTRYDAYDSLPSSILRMSKYPSEKIVPMTLNLTGNNTGTFTTYANSSVVRCVKVKQGDIINYYTYYESTINAGRPITLGFSQYLPAVNGTFTVVDDYRDYSQNTMIDNNYVAPFDGYFCVCHEYGTAYYTNYNFSRILKGDAMAKPLRNEKMVVFGDSIFQFIYSYTGKGLVECLADETNATIIRGAIGGTRIVPRSSSDTYSALDISNLIHSWVTNSWDEVDAAVTAESTTHPEYATIVASLKAVRPTEITSIILEGGLNDLSNSSISFGTATDANIFNESPTNTTLYGAINYIMRDLFSANPYIKVFWVDGMVNFRPVDRTEENWVDNKTYTIDNATYTTPEYFAKLTEQFGKWKVPHISLANICINPVNFSEFFLDGDSTHPYKSFDRMARGIASQIASKNF